MICLESGLKATVQASKGPFSILRIFSPLSTSHKWIAESNELDTTSVTASRHFKSIHNSSSNIILTGCGLINGHRDHAQRMVAQFGHGIEETLLELPNLDVIVHTPGHQDIGPILAILAPSARPNALPVGVVLLVMYRKLKSEVNSATEPSNLSKDRSPTMHTMQWKWDG